MSRNWVYELTPAFVGAHEVNHLSASLIGGWNHKVRAAEVGPLFDEQDLGADSVLYGLLTCDRVLRKVEGLAGVEATDGPVSAWASRYGAGDFISRHRDVAGRAHALLVLERPDAPFGGQLIIETSKGCVKEIDAGVGDLLIFDAHRYAHWTTPLTSDVGYRVIAVARYYGRS